MMARFLGDAVMAAFANDDVTEIYINPQDGHIRYDTRSHGRVESGHALDAIRVEMFLNSVAASLNVTLGATAPRIEAELPALSFSTEPPSGTRSARHRSASVHDSQATGDSVFARRLYRGRSRLTRSIPSAGDRDCGAPKHPHRRRHKQR